MCKKIADSLTYTDFTFSRNGFHVCALACLETLLLFDVDETSCPDVKAVRGAASFALGQFAEHLQPEISEHYERVLPCIFAVLSDAVPDVQVSIQLIRVYSITSMTVDARNISALKFSSYRSFQQFAPASFMPYASLP